MRGTKPEAEAARAAAYDRLAAALPPALLPLLHALDDSIGDLRAYDQDRVLGAVGRFLLDVGQRPLWQRVFAAVAPAETGADLDDVEPPWDVRFCYPDDWDDNVLRPGSRAARVLAQGPN